MPRSRRSPAQPRSDQVCDSSGACARSWAKIAGSRRNGLTRLNNGAPTKIPRVIANNAKRPVTAAMNENRAQQWTERRSGAGNEDEAAADRAGPLGGHAVVGVGDAHRIDDRHEATEQ